MPPEDGVVTFTNPIVLLTTTREISKAQKKNKKRQRFLPTSLLTNSHIRGPNNAAQHDDDD